jgi:hypothetical protein
MVSFDEDLKSPLAPFFKVGTQKQKTLSFDRVCGGSSCPVGDSTFGQIVGGHFNFYFVPGQDADVILTHLA